MAANACIAEITAIGRILAEYNNLEISLLHCVQMGIEDFDRAFKTMFSARGESKRINAACDLASDVYQELGLGNDFTVGIDSIRHALKIRNQYAHWTWWEDNPGKLAIANLEDLAKKRDVVEDFDQLRVYHVDMRLLDEQQAFFVYVDRCLTWVNYEGRFLTGKIKQRIAQKPLPVALPSLHHS